MLIICRPLFISDKYSYVYSDHVFQKDNPGRIMKTERAGTERGGVDLHAKNWSDVCFQIENIKTHWLADCEVFWQWCTTLGINEFLDFVHHPELLRYNMHVALVIFCFQ
jgi:hypothetical protein